MTHYGVLPCPRRRGKGGHSLLLAASFMALSACVRTPAARHVFRQTTTDGVVIALNTGGPKYEGPLFRCERAYVLREEPDRPESLLYGPNGVLRDTAGRCYVMDVGNRRVAVFGPDGRFERAIGRQGGGPGEFDTPLLSLAGLKDGILDVWDPSTRYIHRFRTDGLFLDRIRSPVAGEVYYRPQDDLFIAVRLYGTFEQEQLCWGQEFRARKASGDTVGRAVTPLVHVKYFVPWEGMTRNNGGLEYLPFIREPSMTYAGDQGMASTVGTEPVVEFHAFDGTLQRRMVIEDLPGGEVTAANEAAYRADFDRRMSNLDTGEERYREQQRIRMVFPERRIVWSAIQVDDRGYVWLEVFEEEYERAERGGGVLYDLLSPVGEYLGRTTLPSSGHVSGGHLVGVVTDPASGAETWTVWRLVPLAEGFDYRKTR
jgi:hypothetical protein